MLIKSVLSADVHKLKKIDQTLWQGRDLIIKRKGFTGKIRNPACLYSGDYLASKSLFSCVQMREAIVS
jgi:hypothetical protein